VASCQRSIGTYLQSEGSQSCANVVTLLEQSHHDETGQTLYGVDHVGLAALRVYPHIEAQDVSLPAAGLPWFMTLSGRDGHDRRRLSRPGAGQDPAS
jgi:hypothetical protein